MLDFSLEQRGSLIEGLYAGLGREIVETLGDSVTAFCTGVGSSALLHGVAAAICEVSPEARIVALEPASSAAISAGESGSFRIQGWSGFVPPLYRSDEVDDVLTIADDEAFEMTVRLVREEAVFTGVSGGANVCGALRHKYLAADPFLRFAA